MLDNKNVAGHLYMWEMNLHRVHNFIVWIFSFLNRQIQMEVLLGLKQETQ